ncbi:MAG: cupin domain-containing protein, partial [Planctomycetota bacterium]
AAALVERLDLRPHPEGGFYAETFRSPRRVVPRDGRGERAALTSIYYLLPAGAVSRLHRVASDELWHHCEGAPLELVVLDGSPEQPRRLTLAGTGGGHEPVRAVAAGCWQAARSLGDFTLVSCTVGPGFEFDDFRMLKAGSAEAAALLARHPDLRAFVLPDADAAGDR